MSRRPFGDRPMTNAERLRRHREKRKRDLEALQNKVPIRNRRKLRRSSDNPSEQIKLFADEVEDLSERIAKFIEAHRLEIQ
jgi:hypothetical protein